MLSRIQITNFQCHDRLDLKLDPAITTITGSSDVGKSSILRAIRWVVTNRPLGDGFIRWGQKGVAVRIKVDGHTIERNRSASSNLYSVDKKTLKAFSTDVPEQISNILNLGPVNYQGQHDPTFWFSLTAGEVAKQLNEIVDLGLIDDVMGRIASRLRECRMTQRVVDERLAEAKASRAALKHVMPLNRDLTRLEGLQEQQARQTASDAHIRTIVEGAKEYGERASRLRDAALGGSEAMKRGRMARDVGKRLERLGNLIGGVGNLKVVLDRPSPDLSRLTKLRMQLKEKQTSLAACENQVRMARLREDEKRKGYNKLREAEVCLKEAVGDRCPLCGSLMKGKQDD